jgi:Protein of unknown function (DUF2750)
MVTRIPMHGWQDGIVTVSAAQAAAFYEEVLSGGSVWALRDSEGFPAPINGEGVRAMPFWSKRSRAQRIIDSVPAYEGFEVVELDLASWRNKWLPDLAKNNLSVGLNWSGARATGYDLPADQVAQNLQARSAHDEPPTA